jgi:hypothetical protein
MFTGNAAMLFPGRAFVCGRKARSTEYRNSFNRGDTSTKPIESVRDISAITYGFIASKALLAALDLDVFTRIEGGADTLDRFAEAIDVAPNRTRTLLTALKEVRLVTETDGRFAHAPGPRHVLVTGGPGDFRDYVRVVNGGFVYVGLRHLDQALRGQRIFADSGFCEGIVYAEGGVAALPSALPSMPVRRASTEGVLRAGRWRRVTG